VTINAKRSEKYSWVLRAIALVLGGFVAWAGFYGFFHGNLWYQSYNARTGTFGTGDTLYLGFLGLIILVIGLIPSTKPKKKSR
jgi:hypothetical protein